MLRPPQPPTALLLTTLVDGDTLWGDEWFFFTLFFVSLLSHHTHFQLSFICSLISAVCLSLLPSSSVFHLFLIFSDFLCFPLSHNFLITRLSVTAHLVMTPNHKLHTSHERATHTHTSRSAKVIYPPLPHIPLSMTVGFSSHLQVVP